MKQMAWDEFCTLLSGLNENTPLVKMAQVRKERDPEVLKTFTEEQRRINAEWQRKLLEEDLANMTEEDIMERYAPASRLLDSVLRQQGKI
jgi:hypothetical protein